MIRATLLLLVTTVLVASGAQAEPERERVTKAAPSSETAKPRPRPATARKAIALVRSDPDTSKAASPYKRELGWVAEWRGDRWWLVGLFESSWGVRFVVDAAIIGGEVYTYIDYSSRPSRRWVQAKARRWRLNTLYTRLTPAAAIELAQQSLSFELRRYSVLDAAAKLTTDTGREQGWYFLPRTRLRWAQPHPGRHRPWKKARRGRAVCRRLRLRRAAANPRDRPAPPGGLDSLRHRGEKLDDRPADQYPADYPDDDHAADSNTDASEWQLPRACQPAASSSACVAHSTQTAPLRRSAGVVEIVQ